MCTIKSDNLLNQSYSLLERRMKKFELHQVSFDINPASKEQHKKVRIGFAQEFESSRASLGRSVVSVMNVCSMMIRGKFIKSHMGKELPRKTCLTGPKSLASIETNHFGRNKTWIILSLDPHRKSDEQREIRLCGNAHVLGIRRTYVVWQSNNLPGQCPMSCFMRGW